MDDIAIGQHARETYDQVQAHGDPSPCIPFPSPVIRTSIVVDALVVFPLQGGGTREVCQGIVRAQDLADDDEDDDDTVRAYWPTRRLQRSLYGEVFACLALKRHVGKDKDDDKAQRQAAQSQGLDPFIWESTEEFVAIKRQDRNLFGNAVDDPEMEVAVMQFLDVTKHPNVLESIEALQDATYLYFVTEYCRNGDLFDAVEKSGRMSEPVARFWFRQILSGLHHLQTQGICHRDLSPENILISGDNLKIFDFGMALWEPYNNLTRNDGTVTNILGGKDRRLIQRQKTAGKIRYMVRTFMLLLPLLSRILMIRLVRLSYYPVPRDFFQKNL